ncbi:hypothetical protein M9H77_14593 [Catharanthus roseus]|uniref:Uncharacterized protein n=1 Tax=Catharanthus roseus TaxID=4058 RepID=A0ACC0BNR7_CATRO|nr:hypothetical protein M9H77_14593 [Catharanthus roseus]
MATSSKIVEKLNLKSHPEGGFYAETLRDTSIVLSKSQLPSHCIGNDRISICGFFPAFFNGFWKMIWGINDCDKSDISQIVGTSKVEAKFYSLEKWSNLDGEQEKEKERGDHWRLASAVLYSYGKGCSFYYDVEIQTLQG